MKSIAKSIAAVALSGLVLSSAACQNNGSSNNNGGADQSSGDPDLGGSGIDQAGGGGVFTIRGLNEGQAGTGARVTVRGVLMSPQPWPYVIDGGTGCLYQIVVVQADPSPTLHDGLLAQRTTHPGPTGLDVATCHNLGSSLDIAKAAMGDALTLLGNYRGKDMHLLDLDTGNVTDDGPAAQQPMPVAVQPRDLVSGGFNMPAPAAFFAARGALVFFSTVTTSTPNTASNTFQISQMVNDLTTVSGRYLKALDTNYMLPAAGTAVNSMYALVSTDLGGSVWPRTSADVK